MNLYQTLVEALTYNEEEYLRDELGGEDYNPLEHHTQLFNSHPNKLNQHRIILPLSTTTLNDKVDSQLKLHLLKHGWDIHNYQAGLVSRNTVDRDGNDKLEVRKIGKVLQQTGGDKVYHTKPRDRLIKGSDGKPLVGDDGRMKSEKVKQSLSDFYNADPVRASTKSNHDIVISRDLYDIGGMTSGRSWANDSCMKLPNDDDSGGSNHEKIEDDLKHGTLVAYATKRGDDELEDPVGRVLIKRYKSTNTSDDDEHHYIYRPENKTYGNVPNGFSEHVESLMKKHYPAKPNTGYELEDGLYSDGRRSIKPIKMGLRSGEQKGEINNFNEDGKLNDYVDANGNTIAAIVKRNGGYAHYKNGLEHTVDDNPSSRHIDSSDSVTELYRKNGELHRDGDKPAEIVTDKNGSILKKSFYFGGILHRDGNKPSVIENLSEGHTTQIHHRFGLEHNEHGFSKIEKQPSGGELYERRINGELHSPDNNTPSRKLINYKEVSSYCTGEEYHKNGDLHRDDDLPAVITHTKLYGGDEDKQEYYKNGLLHREGDKPAIIINTIKPNGQSIKIERYYKNGKLTRENGLPHTITT